MKCEQMLKTAVQDEVAQSPQSHGSWTECHELQTVRSQLDLGQQC